MHRRDNVKDRRSLASQKSEGVRAVLEEALIQHGCVQDNVKQHISSGHLCKSALFYWRNAGSCNMTCTVSIGTFGRSRQQQFLDFRCCVHPQDLCPVIVVKHEVH